MNGQAGRFSGTGGLSETSPAGKTAIAACRLIRLTSTWNSAEHPQSVFRMGQPPEAGTRDMGRGTRGNGPPTRHGKDGDDRPVAGNPVENQG